MPKAKVNGIRLFYELNGNGEIPIVLVHGSWASHHTWDALVPLLAETFRVVVYDRRGHSQSERPPGQGSIREDVADLAALTEHLELAPAWVIGNSQGALIALRLAGERAELLRGISCHEPPLFSLVADDPTAAQAWEALKSSNAAVLERIASGDHAGGAELFVEMVVGPGAWSNLPPAYQKELIHHAPTFLDEEQDPDGLTFDTAWITSFARPVLLTTGDQSHPVLSPMYTKLPELIPDVEILTMPGGHVPQRYNPQGYAEAITSWIGKYPA